MACCVALTLNRVDGVSVFWVLAADISCCALLCCVALCRAVCYRQLHGMSDFSALARVIPVAVAYRAAPLHVSGTCKLKSHLNRCSPVYT